MATVTQVCAKVIAENIDMVYVEDCGHKTVSDVYRSEYGYNGLSDKSCKDYLQGLPTVCCVPFYNREILELFKENGIERKTEAGKYSLIEQYWVACGKALHAHIRKENSNRNK